MYSYLLGTYLYDRYEADTGSGGLKNAVSPLVTGFYRDIAPAWLGTGTTAVQSYPYVVWSLVNVEAQDAFKIPIELITVRFSVFSKTETGGQARNAVTERLIGDWRKQATRVPSYGFDRYRFSGAGGTGAFVFRRMYEFPERDIYQQVLEFDLVWSPALT